MGNDSIECKLSGGGSIVRFSRFRRGAHGERCELAVFRAEWAGGVVHDCTR